MIKLGICDDDEKILNLLCKMIEEQYGEQLRVQTWSSPEDLLFYCEEEGGVPLDIVLIDIVLKRESGVELAKKLQQLSRRVKIIFITGFIEFAADIFEIEPVYLLKKPVSVIKLVEAIDRAIDKIHLEESQMITLQSKGVVFRIAVGSIFYVESRERKLLIHQDVGDPIVVYMKMDELEEKLGPTHLFLRCHHSYLINMECIRSFTTHEVIMLDDTTIPVSRPKSKKARECFLAYLGEKI